MTKESHFAPLDASVGVRHSERTVPIGDPCVAVGVPVSQPIDRRVYPRIAATGRGVLVGTGLELGCVIADASKGGFRIRLDRAYPLPQSATLVDMASGTASVVRVAWAKGVEAGLIAEAPSPIRGLVPTRLLPAREAWIRAGGR